MNEVEAIRRVQAHDIGGLRALVEKFQLPAVRAAVLITRDLPLAEEVVQSAFLRFYERAHHFDPGRPFAPYFTRMVVNDAIKAAQRQDRTRSLDQPLDNGTVPLYELLPDPRPGLDSEVSSLTASMYCPPTKPLYARPPDDPVAWADWYVRMAPFGRVLSRRMGLCGRPVGRKCSGSGRPALTSR